MYQSEIPLTKIHVLLPSLFIFLLSCSVSCSLSLFYHYFYIIVRPPLVDFIYLFTMYILLWWLIYAGLSCEECTLKKVPIGDISCSDNTVECNPDHALCFGKIQCKKSVIG